MTEATSTTSTTKKDGTPRKPKGPELNWNADRTAALIGYVAAGDTNTRSLAATLAADPAFAGVPASAITTGKVRLRLANLRKAGVAVPNISRSRDQIDVAGLNAMLGVVVEQPSGE